MANSLIILPQGGTFSENSQQLLALRNLVGKGMTIFREENVDNYFSTLTISPLA